MNSCITYTDTNICKPTEFSFAFILFFSSNNNVNMLNELLLNY